jgi:hypothetical protein
MRVCANCDRKPPLKTGEVFFLPLLLYSMACGAIVIAASQGKLARFSFYYYFSIFYADPANP